MRGKFCDCCHHRTISTDIRWLIEKKLQIPVERLIKIYRHARSTKSRRISVLHNFEIRGLHCLSLRHFLVRLYLHQLRHFILWSKLDNGDKFQIRHTMDQPWVCTQPESTFAVSIRYIDHGLHRDDGSKVVIWLFQIWICEQDMTPMIMQNWEHEFKSTRTSTLCSITIYFAQKGAFPQ